MTSAAADVRVLLAVAVIISGSRVLGWIAGGARQPRVLGELVAGVLLGPSLLGTVWPSASAYLFPEAVLGGLKALGQLGLVLFMFLVGLDLDLEQMRGKGRRAVVISHASIVVPFAAGALLAVWLYPRYGAGHDETSFALFIGIAMAITAFPVLARVLQENGLDGTRIGALALTCAAVDDVTAWCGLAAVVAMMNSSGAIDAVRTVALTLVFVAGMLGLVRPALARIGTISLPMAVAFGLLAAWLTETIGIHAIFGAFLAGVVMPLTSARRDGLTGRLELVTTTLLLPIFFVVVGLSTKVALLDTAALWGVAGLVVTVAVAGKLGGSAVAARLMGETVHDSLVLGVLMNTRGLTEIVILTVGLELRVIDQRMFTIMVIMALVTTFMAGPTLRLLKVSEPPIGCDPAARDGASDGAS